MEKDHDAIKEYYKVHILPFIDCRVYSSNGRMIWLLVHWRKRNHQKDGKQQNSVNKSLILLRDSSNCVQKE